MSRNTPEMITGKTVDEIYYDTKKIIKRLAAVAKKNGAETVYKSKNGSNSVYLKKDDVEIRLSDHAVPQTAERDEREDRCGLRWDRELILTDREIDHQLTELKTEEDLRDFIEKLFEDDED